MPDYLTNKFGASIFVIFLFFYFQVSSQILIDSGSQWSYFKGTKEPSTPSSQWYATDSNTTGWSTGVMPFRYGDGSGGTELSDMYNAYSTLYLRKSFLVDNVNNIDLIKITADYDDGFSLWINGKLLLQRNAPYNIAYNQFAPVNLESGNPEMVEIPKNEAGLVTGTNIIAIQGFKVSRTISDFYQNFKLEGVKNLPLSEAVQCDVASGFFSTPFKVVLSTSQSGENIKYSFDGSDPRTSSTAFWGTTPVAVNIDPTSTQGGRGKTGGVVIRASKFEAGYEPSRPLTRSYIFLNVVKTQSHPGGNWPIYNINEQIIDLPMDSKVYNDSRYKTQMESSLLDIPSLLVSTDLKNLFDPTSGIYVNSIYHGSDWERPANIELINPDKSAGFTIDAGIRIRGGWSRHDNYPKHAFRIFFRSEYGEDKLDFPLFGDEGTDEFDKIDFRTGQNYSWANGGDEAQYQTLNRDLFSRDCQRSMNQLYTRSRFYHLYINGLYWGIYQTQERAEASFAESYLGGSNDDYDVIKVNVGENFNLYEIEATDGNTDSWRNVWNLCQAGFSGNGNYFRLMGMNASGQRDTSLHVMVDIDNLIDYMLIIFYAGNFDSPVSKFRQNSDPNNFFAIYNRNNKQQGFKFLIHDAEHTLLKNQIYPTIGLYENRVNIGSTNENKMYVSRFEKFHPQWLHFKLSENAEYRQRFADHVYRHFYNNGVLTVESCINRFNKSAALINLAIIAESARWGDSKSAMARNKNDTWIPALDQVTNNYMPYRTGIVLNQLIAENLYNSLNPPVFKNNGTEIKIDKITISENYSLTLENKNLNGTIYYSLNGVDPRATGGTNSSSAIYGGNSITISVVPGSKLKARVKNGNTWSALHEIIFEDSGLFTTLKITELHYHPKDQGAIDGKQLEFIELKNTGSKILDLSGLMFTDGIQFTFPAGTSLAPGAFVVVASNKTEFASLYKTQANFEYTGNLSNSGESVVLQTSTNQNVISFTFLDSIPWPLEADGDGYSLVSNVVNPNGNPDSNTYWTISKFENGSPGTDDIISGIDNINYIVEGNRTFELYPNPTSLAFRIEFNLETSDKVEISIYDLNGRLVELILNEQMQVGFYSKFVEPVRIENSGIYIVAMKKSNTMITKKLVVQK